MIGEEEKQLREKEWEREAIDESIKSELNESKELQEVKLNFSRDMIENNRRRGSRAPCRTQVMSKEKTTEIIDKLKKMNIDLSHQNLSDSSDNQVDMEDSFEGNFLEEESQDRFK